MLVTLIPSNDKIQITVVLLSRAPSFEETGSANLVPFRIVPLLWVPYFAYNLSSGQNSDEKYRNHLRSRF